MLKHLLNASGAALTLAALTAGAGVVHSSSSTAGIIKTAEGDAANAGKALAKRKPDDAIRFAEHAVQLRPQDATYRALLGKAYLAAGRFFSARQAFADALHLDPGLPGVALNLALASTATGDYAAARAVLADADNGIAPADRGLAIALAGDPAAGVELLMAVARSSASDAKTRQNLALAFALAGRWGEARQVALVDLSPADADARIVQWAAFAQPKAASDQVSALLGVTPVADTGQPVQFALVAAPVQIAQVETADPAPQPEPRADVAAIDATPAPVATDIDTPRPSVGPSVGVVFAERREIVQSLPVQTARSAPVRAARTPHAPAATRSYYVQLGAFRGADSARAAWGRARARHATLLDKAPSTMPAPNGLVRVSVGGFVRADADTVCRSVKAGGGSCFVRSGAGDRLASWGRTQVAAR